MPSVLGETNDRKQFTPLADAEPKPEALSSLFAEAEKYCGSFHWKKAAETFNAFLALLSTDDIAGRGQALGRISWCRFRAAMQSETTTGFACGIRQAIFAQRQAKAQFKRLGGKGIAQVLCSRAMSAYFAHWLAKSPAKKKRLLDESWNMARESLGLFEASKNHSAYVETYNRLSFAVALSVEYDENLRSRIRKMKQAIQCGKKTILMAESVGNKQAFAEALVKTSLFLNGLADDYSVHGQSGQNRRDALELWQKAMILDRKTSLLEISHPLSGFHQSPDPSANLRLCMEALEFVRPQRDQFVIGRLMDQLAKWTHYVAQSSESGTDPTLGPNMRAEALSYAEEAAERYNIINFTSPIAGVLWVHSPSAEHFQELARYETDPANRRLLMEKSLRCTGELLRLARRSENRRVMFYAFHTCTKCEVVLSANETDERRKRELLLDARSHSINAYRLAGQVGPRKSWNRGVTARAVAGVLSRLAELERTPRRKGQLLFDAVAMLEEALEVTTAFVSTLQRPAHKILTAQIGQYYGEYADTLRQLGLLTGREEYLRKAVKEYSAAADWYGRVPRYDRLAECYWKRAETYDQLQVYSLASENFILAARSYSKLGRRIHPLKEHSEDYRRYLSAWSKIELARAFHSRALYHAAAGLYNSASRLLDTTKRWRFLASHYLARGKLEWGENLSRLGLRSAAKSKFGQAAVLFAHSATHLKRRLPLIDQADEKKMVIELLDAPGGEYCHIREILEEAIEAESLEDYRSSYEKFGLVSENLREVLKPSASEQDRREIEFLSALCEAWSLSCKAEIDSSTEILKQASVRFEKARDISPNENARMLAQGHQAFCNSLISSRNFAEKHDLSFHEEASKQLDLASDYYLKAGFKSASANALAQKLLIEAFRQLNVASGEKSQDEKTKLYEVANVLLSESAQMFVRAHQTRKADLARSFLRRTKVESKIASQLINILDIWHRAPTNIAFHSQITGGEKPAGLDRFEQGDLEARLVKVTTGLPAERNVAVEIEITNTGKQTIQLVSLDDVVPEDAEFIESPQKWIPKGRSLLGALRKIDSLKTETVSIKFRPKGEGLLTIEPKITFVDATGTQIQRTIEKRVSTTSPIMVFLANSFLGDFSGRLAIPNCGWRTLMSIVEALKIPRSHVYGEPRYGRQFGRQLYALVKSYFVEYRIFTGERGRGGEVTKVRVNLDNRDVRRFLEEISATGNRPPLSIVPFIHKPAQSIANLSQPG